MLFLHGGSAPQIWSSGSAPVDVAVEHGSGAMPVAVWCRFGRLEAEQALLDTGSEWSVVGGEAAELLEPDLGPERGRLKLKSRHGEHEGVLHELKMELIANQGKHLVIDGLCLVARSWPGPSVVGFRGFLERIRLALDPADSEVRAFFGPISAR